MIFSLTVTATTSMTASQSIACRLCELPAKKIVLDVEIEENYVHGRLQFARLHMRTTEPGTVHLWAFDFLSRGPPSAGAGEAPGATAGPIGALRLRGRLAIRTPLEWGTCRWPVVVQDL